MYSLAAWITGTWAGFTVNAKKGGLGAEIHSFGQEIWFCLFSFAYRVKRHNYKYITIILNSYIRHTPWKWPEWRRGLNLTSAGGIFYILLPVPMTTKLQTKWEHWTLPSQRTHRQNYRLLLMALVHAHNPQVTDSPMPDQELRALKWPLGLLIMKSKTANF